MRSKFNFKHQQLLFSVSPFSASALSFIVSLRTCFFHARGKKLTITTCPLYLRIQISSERLLFKVTMKLLPPVPVFFVLILILYVIIIQKWWLVSLWSVLLLDQLTWARATPLPLQLCWLGLEKEGIFSEGKKLVLETQADRCLPESLETECHEWQREEMAGSFQRKMKGVKSDQAAEHAIPFGLTGVPGFRNETITTNLGENGAGQASCEGDWGDNNQGVGGRLLTQVRSNISLTRTL